MSSIGRPSATIDLNKTTLSAVSLLNEQLEQAELDIDALELRTTDLESRSTVLEDNLGLPSLQEIYDDTNNLIQEQRNATGLNLKVETNETHIFTNAGNISTNTIDIATNTGNISTNTIDIATNTESINTINETIGSDTIDPKTGIFLKLQNLQEGHEIIPNYDYTGVYLILLNDLIDTENDPNITINNSENKHLNEILLDMQKKIDILEKNNDLTRGMLTQTGYGLGSTAIRSMATAPILFNSRSLDALGINEGSIPTFSLLDTSQASIDSFAIEISNWIYSVIPAPIMTIFETITGKTKEEFIQDIIRAQNPQKFIEAEFLSRVKIGINGDLYIKPSDISHPKGIPELAFSYLNASEIITKANNLANIQTIGTGLDLSITHDLSVDLKGNGGLELSGNQIELTYPIFGIGGAITMDEINHIHVKADEITLTFDIVAKHLKISTTYIEEREGEIEVLQGQIDTIKVGVGLEELTAAGSGWFDWLEGGFGSLFSAGSDATLAGGIGYVASQANSANDKADKLLDLITPGSGSYDDNGYFINSGNIGIGYSKNDNIPEKLSVNGNIKCDNIKSKAFIAPNGTELYLNNVDKRVREEGETTTQISLIDDYHTKTYINTNYHNKTYIDTNFALKSSLNTFDGNYKSLTDRPDFTNNFIFGESFPQIITNYETGELIYTNPFFRFQVSGDGVAGRGNIHNNAMVIRSDTTPFIMALNNQPTGDAILNLQINFDNFVPPTNTEEQQNAVGAQLGYRKSESISEFSGLYFRNLNSSYNVFGGIFTLPNENEWTMVLHDNKNVGIGTVHPSERLEVNGNIKCDKVFANVLIDNAGIELYIGNVPDTEDGGITRRSLNDYVQSSDLHIVATSGSYNDLSSKPNLFSGSYNDLSSKPDLFSGSYNDLSSKPNLFSGSYNDLSSKPNLFSGSYNDLSSKPDLTVYSTFSGSYNDLSSKPNLFSGSYNDLSSKPDLSVYSTFSGSYNDLSSKPNLFSGSYDDLSSKPDLSVYSTFSGSYNDLSSKPDLSVYSTITQLENYYTKTEVDNIDLTNYAHKSFLFVEATGNEYSLIQYDSYDPYNIGFTGIDRNGAIQSGTLPIFFKNDKIQISNLVNWHNYDTGGSIPHYLIFPDGTHIVVSSFMDDNNTYITLNQFGNYGWAIKTSPGADGALFETQHIFTVQDKADYTDNLLPNLTYGDFQVNNLLSTKGYLTEHQSLELYALKTELNTYSDSDVQTYLNDNSYITTSSLDLSGYYNKTEVDSLLTNLEIPSSIPNDLLVLPSEAYAIQVNGNYIIGKQRNFSTSLVQDITTNIYLLRYQSFYFETNYINVYSNDTITIIYNNEIIPNYYNATNYNYLRLFYLLKTENVSLDILGRNADQGNNISGIVGEYEIIQNNATAQYQYGSDIKTTITFTFPKDINPLYEYRIGFGKTDSLGGHYSGYKQSRFIVQNNPQSDSINNDYINDLPIDNIVFPNTTGFLKITNGNLSYDSTGGGSSSSENQDLTPYALIANTFSQTEINNNFVKKTDLYDGGNKINDNLLNFITNNKIDTSYIDQSTLNFITDYPSIEYNVQSTIADYLSTNNFINQLSAGNNITISGENDSRTISCTLQNTDTIYSGTANQIDITNNIISISPNFSTGQTYTAGEGIEINGNEISSTVVNTYLTYTPTIDEIDISSGNQISISSVFKQNHTYTGKTNEIIIDMDNQISIDPNNTNYNIISIWQQLINANKLAVWTDYSLTGNPTEDGQFIQAVSHTGGYHFEWKKTIDWEHLKSGVIDGYLYYNSDSGVWGIVASDLSIGGGFQDFQGISTGISPRRSTLSTAPIIETVDYIRFSEEVEFNGNISLENINETIYLNFQMYSNDDKTTSLKDRADIFLCNDIKQWTFDRLPLPANLDTYGTLFRINYENKLHILRNQIECFVDLKVSKIIFGDNTELTSAPSGTGGGSVSYPLTGEDIFNVGEYYSTTDGNYRLFFISGGVSIINSLTSVDCRINNVSKLIVNDTNISAQVNITTPSLTFSDGTQITTAPLSGFSGDYNDLINIPTSSSFSGNYNDLTNIPSVNPLNSSGIFKYSENITSTDGQTRFYFFQNNATRIDSPISMQFRVDNSLKLHIRNNAYMDCLATGVSTTGGANKSFWSPGANALYSNSTYPFPISFSTSQGIWVRGYYFLSSSDRRIKKDIYELNDKECLDKLLLLKPCKYKHKDSISRGDRETYGFIAQEVEEIMPEAVKTKDHFIPNIYKIGKYNDHVITLNETTEYTPIQGDIIMIYDENDILTETTILEVYSDVSFKIENEILTENVFIYGSKIDDFKTLIKEMFHPICVSSIQEHNKIINEQQEKINELEAKINMLMEHLNLS